MLCHIVMFRFAETTTPADIERLEAAISTLPELIPEIRDYRYGRDATGDDGNWDFALIASFDDAEGYRVYRDDERHLAIIAEVIRPIIAARAAIQVEL